MWNNAAAHSRFSTLGWAWSCRSFCCLLSAGAGSDDGLAADPVLSILLLIVSSVCLFGWKCYRSCFSWPPPGSCALATAAALSRMLSTSLSFLPLACHSDLTDALSCSPSKPLLFLGCSRFTISAARDGKSNFWGKLTYPHIRSLSSAVYDCSSGVPLFTGSAFGCCHLCPWWWLTFCWWLLDRIKSLTLSTPKSPRNISSACLFPDLCLQSVLSFAVCAWMSRCGVWPPIRWSLSSTINFTGWTWTVFLLLLKPGLYFLTEWRRDRAWIWKECQIALFLDFLLCCLCFGWAVARTRSLCCDLPTNFSSAPSIWSDLLAHSRFSTVSCSTSRSSHLWRLSGCRSIFRICCAVRKAICTVFGW